MKRVKLSLNAPLRELPVVEKAGYDCIEPSNTDIMKMTPYDFLQAKKALQNSPVECTVVDNPIPCSVSFSDSSFDIRAWVDYLKLSAERAKSLGAVYWCFGNGASRMLPDDENERVKTMVTIYGAVCMCADIAKEAGMKVIVEPLGPSVTNYLNTVPETVAFVDELNRTNVTAMVDYRWEYEQRRPNSDLYQYADRIAHAHIDNPGTDYFSQKIRKVQSLDDGFDYTEFLDFIKSYSFRSILSIEANSFTDYEREVTEAIHFYRAHDIIPFRNI